MDTTEIKKMSTLERLQTMEAIWNSLLYENEDIEAPGWHGEVIEERKRKIENNEARFVSVNDLKKRTQ